MTPQRIVSIYGLTPEITYYWRGRGEVQKTATPAGALTDLEFWLGENVAFVGQHTTVVFPRSPVDGDRDYLRDRIQALGWKTERTRGGWFTCRKGQGRMVHLCVLAWVPSSDPMIGGLAHSGWNESTREIVRCLANWQRLADIPYRHTPGVAGHAWIRAMPRRRAISWAPYKDRGALPGWEPPFEIRPFMWAASYLEGRPIRPQLKWDTRAAYLRAMSAAELPAGPLRNTGNSPEGAGYLRVKIFRRPDAGTPSLTRIVEILGLEPDGHGCYGIGTATADVLRRSGFDLEVIDSQTAPCGRLLRPWAELVGKLPDEIRKPVYTESFGMLATRTGSIQRRDWYHLIIDQGNATLLRRIIHVYRNTGLWPVEAARADSVVYAVELERESEFSGLLGAGMRFEGEL